MNMACSKQYSLVNRSVASCWGFSRFVNIRGGKGETPLHLAARQRRPECVHILLDNGALVCASTGGHGLPGSTPLHLAARGGSMDCIRELLAWGADRLHRDASGRIPYAVALKHKNGACTPNISDLYPWLKRFDLQGVRSKMDRDAGKAIEIATGWVEELVKERRKEAGHGDGRRKDFLDVLLDYEGAGKDEPEKMSGLDEQHHTVLGEVRDDEYGEGSGGVSSAFEGVREAEDAGTDDGDENIGESLELRRRDELGTFT